MPFLSRIKKLVINTDFLFVAFITLLVAYISYQNYTPGTWLTGWDNLHPEFNLGLNIKRSLNAVWQEGQGLGLLSGMAHATDLSRQLVLAVLSLILPLNSLRYVYFFLMLWLGPVGTYFLVRYLPSFYKPAQEARPTALAAGLFYLLNIGTVLNFYAPIEFFNTMYGFLPWLVLYYLKYLIEKRKQDLVIFSVLSFFGLQMAYVPTLFVVYAFVLLVLTVYLGISEKFNKEFLRNLVIIVLAAFCINAYWLLPFARFALFRSGNVIESKISSMSSENTYLLNKKDGTFANTALLKGFWFGNLDMDETGRFSGMFKEWNTHLDSPYIQGVGFTLFGICILGFASIFLLRYEKLYVFGVLFVLSILLLMSGNPPFGFIYEFVRDRIPLFREMFRFTYTKFSPLAIFTYSIMFGLGTGFLVNLSKKYLRIILSTMLLGLMVVWVFPVFRGYLIYPKLRISIPNEYFEMFRFLNRQKPGERLADLPQHTFWSWKFYSWGYRGSGFIWYGINQPVMDRAFDVWNSSNEAYYHELSQAIYSENPQHFREVLWKYSITWVLLDKNILSSSSREALKVNTLQSFLTNREYFEDPHVFSGLELYRVKNAIGLAGQENKLTKAVTLHKYTDRDFLFSEVGSYYSDIEEPNNLGVQVPFYGLGYDSAISIDNPTNTPEIKVSRELRDSVGGASLTVPDYLKLEAYIPAQITLGLGGKTLSVSVRYLYPRVNINGQPVKAYENEVYNYSYTLNPLALGQDVLIEVGGDEYLVFKVADLQKSQLSKNVVLRTVDNEIKILTDIPGKTIDASSMLQTKEVTKCSADAEDSYIERKTTQDGSLKLLVKNVSGCLNVDINGLIMPSTEVLGVSFDYRSKNTEKPGYCLYNSASTICMNRKDNNYGFSKTLKHFQEFVNINVQSEKYVEFGVVLEGYKSLEERGIEYKNIILTQYRVLSTFVSKPNQLPKEVAIPDNIGEERSRLEVAVSKYPSYNSRKIGFLANYYNDRAGNCQNFLGDSKQFATMGASAGTLHYSASNAVLCDYYQLPRFYHSASYLVSVKHRNIVGTPLEVCFGNPLTYRCVADNYLPKSSDWLYSYIVVRNQESGGRGYTLGIYNNAYGMDYSKNDLDYADVDVFPANWISGITVKSLGELESGISGDSGLDRITEWLYTKKTIDSSKVLILNQGFENGWLALCGFLPCNARHVLVNNWANGWVFTGDSIPRAVVVLFWPQALEYLGFLVLAGWLVYLFYPRPNPSKSPTL